jgi:hypothetical protein
VAITFNGWTFAGPYPLSVWQPPGSSGLYAILVPDSSAKPQPFRVIYFGQTGDFSERGFPSSHHAYRCWLREAGSPASVFIATYSAAGWSNADRRNTERYLVQTYQPSCNR